MRITAELLTQCEQRTNPLGERELSLRALGILHLENTASTRDAFDTWDLSHNRLTRLDNFPRLSRLSHLICPGNWIESVDAENMATNTPNIKTLVLTDNRITSLSEVANIGKACPKIEILCLHGNPVTRQQHYRLYAIHHMPLLRALDYVKVKMSEREQARRFANSAAGASLAADLEKDVVKTFEPGRGADDQGNQHSFDTAFTDEEKEMIKTTLANASSVAEFEEIEASIRKGIVPKLRKRTAVDDPILSATTEIVTEISGDAGSLVSESDHKRRRVGA